MNSDDDTFFEEDEYDEEDEEDDFPDEEYEYDEEDEDYELSDVLDEPRSERLRNFVEDPWPPTTFVLVIIGLAMVLLTPPAIWSIWNYFLIAEYFMVILGGAAMAYSLMTWDRAGKHRLRWAGITNFIVVIALIIVGSIDTFSWILTGASIFPNIDTPIISLAMVLEVFSIYSLWAIQRNFGPPQR